MSEIHNSWIKLGVIINKSDDEVIDRRGANYDLMPEPLKQARILQTHPRSDIGLQGNILFHKQGKLLANCTYNTDIIYAPSRFAPSYESLTNIELKSYISWRTKWREGKTCPYCKTYCQIYADELINLISGITPQIAVQELIKLRNFCKTYDSCSVLITDMDEWIRDMVLWYELDYKVLIDNNRDFNLLHSLSILDDMQNHSKDELFQAVINLSDKTITTSKLYKVHPKALKEVVLLTLLNLKQHYAQHRQKRWIEDYFGEFQTNYFSIFNKTHFITHDNVSDKEVMINSLLYYTFEDSTWRECRLVFIKQNVEQFHHLIKTIDAQLRYALKFDYHIKPKITTKWILNIIEESILTYLKKQRDSELKQKLKTRTVNIDLSQLQSIRNDSAETLKKLITDEESYSIPEIVVVNDQHKDKTINDCIHSLSSEEKLYLECLLNKSSTNWITDKGLLASILCDSINEKLYDVFGDNVLEDGVIIEDYTEQLRKEI